MDSRLRVPKHIFECYVEVARPKEGEDTCFTYICPKDYEWEEDTRKQLPKFMFPTIACNETEEHFTFVLTDLDGKYRFGFCRYPPKGDVCMCFLSDFPWYKVFYRAMDKISDMRLDMQSECVEPLLIGLWGHTLPTLGTDSILSVVPDGVDAGQVFSFPLPNPKRLPEIPTDDNLTQFYTNLHHNVVLHLFANMMFERRIIITSKSLSMLSSCVHGAVMLLYPLHWQHIFIPITPPHLADYCAAPMPFLMGVHSSLMEQVRQMPLDEVVILDVDESTLESPHVEDLASLPPDITSNLKQVLKKHSSAYGDTVTRAFMLAQVSMIGGYRSALKLRMEEKQVLFDENVFMMSRPGMEEFLKELLNFQHFRQFINGRIDKLKSQSVERDLFDNEVLMYEEVLRGGQVKLAFDKFMGGSKRLWEVTKGGSEQLGHKLSKQARAIQNYKVVDKGWKSTVSWVKETKRQLQGIRDKDKIVPSDYEYTGHTIANRAILETTQFDKKYHSLPDAKRSPPAVHRSTNYSLPHGRGSPTTGRVPVPGNRPPPPVIPYHRHVQGKRKLAESLRQQCGSHPEHSDASSGSDVPVGILLSFTPPDTPRIVQNSDQSSVDRSERASLESEEINVVSIDISPGSEDGAARDVATGNLLELSSSSSKDTFSANLQPSAWGDRKSSEKDDSDKESVISTASSSSDQSTPEHWEKFDEDQDLRPPLPPPRSALRHFYDNNQRQNSTSPDYSLESSNDDGRTNFLNPFDEVPTGRTSPIDDFSASIAESLFSNSRQRSDPFAASTFATTGMDLIKTSVTLDVQREQSPPAPLIAVASTGDATAELPTTLPSIRSSPQFSRNHFDGATSNSLNGGVFGLVQYKSGGGSTPNLHSGHHGDILMASSSAGCSPVRSTKVNHEECVGHLTSESRRTESLSGAAPSKRPPPPKPKPYSGGAMSFLQQNMRSRAGAMSTQIAAGDSNGHDPFSSLFGEGGMEAYASISTGFSGAKENSTSSLSQAEHEPAP